MNRVYFDQNSLELPLATGFHAWSFSLKKDEKWIPFQYNGQFAAAREMAIREAARNGCTLVRLEGY